jgi:hypothetical protein
VAFLAFQNATELIAVQAEDIYREMEKSLPELAAELAATLEFRTQEQPVLASNVRETS